MQSVCECEIRPWTFHLRIITLKVGLISKHTFTVVHQKHFCTTHLPSLWQLDTVFSLCLIVCSLPCPFLSLYFLSCSQGMEKYTSLSVLSMCGRGIIHLNLRVWERERWENMQSVIKRVWAVEWEGNVQNSVLAYCPYYTAKYNMYTVNFSMWKEYPDGPWRICSIFGADFGGRAAQFCKID